MALLCLCLGLRISECLALKWADINPILTWPAGPRVQFASCHAPSPLHTLFMPMYRGPSPGARLRPLHGRDQRRIAATSQYLASQAGADILRRGGSAMDAAIAANAVLGVTEPMMNGIGGDLFLLYWDAKTGKLYGLNASGWAPRQALHRLPQETGSVDAARRHSQRHRSRRRRWLEQSCISALEASVERSFSARDLLRRTGYAVAEIASGYWKGAGQTQRNCRGHARLSAAWKSSRDRREISNPDLAGLSRLIADQGRDAFYRGEIRRRS